MTRLLPAFGQNCYFCHVASNAVSTVFQYITATSYIYRVRVYSYQYSITQIVGHFHWKQSWCAFFFQREKLSKLEFESTTFGHTIQRLGTNNLAAQLCRRHNINNTRQPDGRTNTYTARELLYLAGMAQKITTVNRI